MSALTKIRWLKPDEGGRVAPLGDNSIPPLRSLSRRSKRSGSRTRGSLVLNLEGPPDENWTQTALVRFLADEARAPAQWLQPDSRFALRGYSQHFLIQE